MAKKSPPGAKQAARPPKSGVPDAALRPTDAITLYTNLLSALNDSHETLLSPEMHVLMEGATEAEKADFATQVLAVGRARLKLGNAVLSKIADALEANETDLQTGEANLKEALKKLATIAEVLGAIATVAGLAAKIVPLI